MATSTLTRKRKAITRDSASSEQPALVDELGNRALDNALDGDEEDDSASGSEIEDEEGFDDEEDLDSDEIPSEDDKESGKDKARFTTTTDANGNPRYVYREIDPVYDSDDSDAPDSANTIGNIPLSFYDTYPHIGYDINGKRVMRPAKGAALDTLLDQIELPKGWTGLTDPVTGKPLALTDEELDVLKKVTRNEMPGEGYDPYPDMVEYFTNTVEPMPLSAAPEPKRRFVPSKHEAKRVMKIVRAIREGRIQPYRPPEEREEEETDIIKYDIWADEAPRADHPMNVPAPKLPPPGYDESYHPPPEYLPDQEEEKAWKEADEEDREKEYLPANYDALRRVPGYERFVKEKFERCLDLYLAPRVRRNKLNIDPESLLPKLPSPEELRPFPSRCSKVFRGHNGRVRSLSIDPRGILLASGGDDGTVRIWSLEDGRQEWSVKLSDQDPVHVVCWRPGTDACILAAAAGESVFLITPDTLPHATPDADLTLASREILTSGFSALSATTSSTSAGKEGPAKWVRPEARLHDRGVLVQVVVRAAIKVIAWHRRGDYFSTVSPTGQSTSVAIHTLSKHLTQLPFRKLKGLAQFVQFHPSKPVFFVATQRMIRSYDLAKQELLKILQPGARWISSFDVHPGGDNLIVGSYDKRLLWIDMDLSARPYKTLRYHTKAIRSVKYHQGGYPLFADASDDGSLQVFHGKVVDDLMENATIVPLKVLKGHEVKSGLGVLDIEWHPKDPVLVSAGADGTCRMWV